MEWFDEVEGLPITGTNQVVRDDTTYPPSIFAKDGNGNRLWSDAELRAIGVYPFVEIVRDKDYDYGEFKCTKMSNVYQETTSSTKKLITVRAAAKLVQINYQCDEEINALTASYPRAERDSWYKQAAEANAYAANSGAFTPLLDAMTANNSTDKAALVVRILAKIDMFAAVVGSILKKKNDLELRLDAGEEPNDVNWI